MEMSYNTGLCRLKDVLLRVGRAKAVLLPVVALLVRGELLLKKRRILYLVALKALRDLKSYPQPFFLLILAGNF